MGARAATLALVLACRDAFALQSHAAGSHQLGSEDLETKLMAAPVSVRPSSGQAPDQVKMHFHVHKAGGTLMCKLASLANETVPVYDGTYNNCNWLEHDDLRDSGFPEHFPNCNVRTKVFASSGWTYGQMEREITDDDFCDGFFYSILLREPLDLIQSNFAYEQVHGGAHGAVDRIHHMRRLTRYGAEPDDLYAGLAPMWGWKFMDNMQTRLLGGAIDVPPGQVAEKHLAKAKERLARFNVVAKLSDIDDPVKRAQFFKAMGWNITMDMVPHANSYNRLDELTPRQVDWLRELNWLDYDLYNSV